MLEDNALMEETDLQLKSIPGVANTSAAYELAEGFSTVQDVLHIVSYAVIAVPTSVGYGASMHGLSALLTMINSCANGIAVVNIDNGYGAGYLATQINRLAAGADEKGN